jgi:hypothetical protein
VGDQPQVAFPLPLTHLPLCAATTASYTPRPFCLPLSWKPLFWGAAATRLTHMGRCRDMKRATAPPYRAFKQTSRQCGETTEERWC